MYSLGIERIIERAGFSASSASGGIIKSGNRIPRLIFGRNLREQNFYLSLI